MNDNKEQIFAIAMRAFAFAQSRFHLEVSLEHVLFVLLERPEVEKFFKDFNVNQQFIQKELDVLLNSLPFSQVCQTPLKTKEYNEVFGRAIAFSSLHRGLLRMDWIYCYI